MVSEQLETIIREGQAAEQERKRLLVQDLNESFKKHSFPVGERTWTRADLHERR